MRVYLIRHGESEGNVAGVPCGWGEFALSEKGKEQARQVGEQLRKLPPFDKIYVSDLLRTRQTFEQAFGAETEHTLCPLLREINVPFVGQNSKELREKYGEAYLRACREMDFREFGYETGEMLLRRIRFFKEEFLEKDTQSQRVAIVAHGGVIRTFLACTVNQTLPQVIAQVDNCSVSVFDYMPEINCWKLLAFNWTPDLLS